MRAPPTAIGSRTRSAWRRRPSGRPRKLFEDLRDVTCAVRRCGRMIELVATLRRTGTQEQSPSPTALALERGEGSWRALQRAGDPATAICHNVCMGTPSSRARQHAAHHRHGRGAQRPENAQAPPIFMVDLAVPRGIEQVAALSDVCLYTVDDLTLSAGCRPPAKRQAWRWPGRAIIDTGRYSRASAHWLDQHASDTASGPSATPGR